MSSEVPAGWRSRRLGGFLSRVRRKNQAGRDLEPLSITKDRGVIPQRLKYKKRIATDPRKYVIGEDGDFAYDPMSLYYGAIGRIDGIGKGLISPDYVVLQADCTVDHDYLLHHLRSPAMLPIYELHSETSNSFGKRRRLYWSILEHVSVSLPPLPEQKKIAAILSSVDEAIQATQAVIEQTRRVKEGLLQDLLTKGIGPGGLPHTRFKQTEIGEIPEGWEVAPLRTLGLVDCGKAKNAKQDAPMRPYLRVANILDDRIDESNVYSMPFTHDEFSKYKLEPGDILLNEGQSLKLVGRPAVYRGNPPDVAMQNALLRWRVDPSRVSPEFGYQTIRYLYNTKVFSRVATQTTSIAHLGLKRFAGIRIAVPPLDEQRGIADSLAAFDDMLQSGGSEVAQLQQLKAGLLQDLLTGKVRVSV